jgi:hypothetical protein
VVLKLLISVEPWRLKPIFCQTPVKETVPFGSKNEVQPLKANLNLKK